MFENLHLTEADRAEVERQFNIALQGERRKLQKEREKEAAFRDLLQRTGFRNHTEAILNKSRDFVQSLEVDNGKIRNKAAAEKWIQETWGDLK